jgi:hypothetical protein
LWKNSNGPANQKPNDSKTFAWFLVELMAIHATGISVKIANRNASTVSSGTVPRRSPYSSAGMAASCSSSRSRLRRSRRVSGVGADASAAARGATDALMRTPFSGAGR